MADTDTDNESNRSSLDMPESDIYLTEHLAAHVSATQHHLTGAPEPPEPPYAPSFYPPTGYWTAAEKALFFRALGVHSRFRPDLIAASIGTKSAVDVAVYLSLLRDGASRASPSITRDLHPAAHEVSITLVALEGEHATRTCAAERAHAGEETSEARAEEARNVKNAMRMRRGERGKGQGRDREGQRARREEFERWQEEREVEWAREDVLGRLDVVGLQVLDRMLRLDEESREEEADSGDELEEEGEPSITPHHPAASSPSPNPPSPNDDTEDEDLSANPSRLSPASRRRIRKRLYMRCKRAKASGGVAQLNPARLKPGRKASAMSKYKQPRVDDDSEDETGNPKQHARGNTRPYKIQRELERLGIGADYLHENGMGLFHLSALGRLMRLYPRLDVSQPQGVAESIAAETIQMLHALVTQFVRDLVRRAIALRELDFALRAHTKVWRLGKRVVHPLHVRRALELCGRDAQSSKRAHFSALLERFSEGEESMESDDDVPLAVRARMAKGKAVAFIEDEDEDDDEGRADDVGLVDQQEQRACSSADPQTRDTTGPHWSLAHREMYSPFVYAPDLIAPAHPFGVYAPGTTPDAQGSSTSALLRYAAEDDVSEEDGDMDAWQDEGQEGLMPAETDDEALEAELRAEARLDAADARAAAEYEAGVWHELRDAGQRGPSQRARKRRAGAEISGDDVHSVRLRKRRKGALGGWVPVVAEAGMDALEEPDGVRVKSAAMIEDSDSEYLG